MLNDSEEIAEDVLGTFDRPEEYEILQVNITYEL